MKFRKKPVTIEAVQIPAAGQQIEGAPTWLIDAARTAHVRFADDGSVVISTLEGDMRGEPGDWIIQGIKGEFYPCKPDIFAATYEAAGAKPIVHADMVRALAKPGAAIAASLTPENAHLLHMAVGVSGEAGELLDAVKKAAIYCKPLDHANVIEELGDLEFYMEGLRQGLGITREETLAANVAKLGKRYSSGTYSDQQAQARADKAAAA